MSERAVSRVDNLVRECQRRFPNVLAVCGQLRDSAQADGMAWPPWCWLPMGGVFAYLSTQPAQPAQDLARVTALTTWMLGRGVYQPEPDAADAAVHELRSPAGVDAAAWNRARLPPLQEWTRLPEWCCYVTWPADFSPAATFDAAFSPQGVFVHLEHDTNTNRPELRLLLDTDGTWDGLVPIPVYLDRRNLGAAIADMTAVTRATAAGATGADVHAITHADAETQLGGLLAFNILPLVLTLIDSRSHFVNPAEPGASPTYAHQQSGMWKPAPATRLWTVTMRQPGR